MEQHVQITGALKSRNGARAEALLQQHISDFQQEIKEAL
jgi:DNA-binding GntR family transcriptional regulator